ncbi:HigA family addiction module antidote protein [Vibrio phage V039C]|nr:HigA family addiction module antidote protein [Vibrio phage V039C]
MSFHKHPGEFLKKAYMEPLNLTCTDVAKNLDVSTASVSRLVQGKASLSFDMAMRLSKMFSTPVEQWMNMQLFYNIDKFDNSTIDSIGVVYAKHDSCEYKFTPNKDHEVIEPCRNEIETNSKEEE